MINSIINAITATAAVGTLSAGMLLSYVAAVDYIVPTLEAAMAYQEATISTYEDAIGGEGARKAREQWESAEHKPKALAGIETLKSWSTAIKATFEGSEPTREQSNLTMFES